MSTIRFDLKVFGRERLKKSQQDPGPSRPREYLFILQPRFKARVVPDLDMGGGSTDAKILAIAIKGQTDVSSIFSSVGRGCDESATPATKERRKSFKLPIENAVGTHHRP